MQPFRTEEFDNVTPQLTSAGYLVPLNTPTINPNFGTIKGSVYDGTFFLQCTGSWKFRKE